MNKYESVIIVKEDLEEEIKKGVEDKYSELIKNNGILNNVDNLGIKKLAYEIKGYKEGLYIVFYFESEFEFISKLEKKYREDDNVIKFIVVKMED